MEIKGQEHYVDIKVADLESSTADNTNCLAGIFYVLTGKHPPKSNVGIIKEIKEQMKENDKDFYFLVVNKNYSPDSVSGLKRSYAFSLRGLRKVRPNGNNLPFQCNWKENLQPVARNYQEARDFLLGNYGASLKKRADMYFEFKKSFPDISI